MLVDTDYLVVGAGTSGLAFTDALVAEADVEVTVVDRQEAPGGHWLHAYPFVRLHTPSAYYGVNSLALGENRVDGVGENAGYYERATGSEVREHFAEAAAQLERTGRVRLLTGHEHVGRGSNGEQVRDLSTGKFHDVLVRRKVVDARYLEASIPGHARPLVRSCSVRAGRPCHRPADGCGDGFLLCRPWVWQDGKNRLCPPHAYPSGPEDWPRMMCSTWKAEARWLSEPDIAAWIAESRLNLMGGLLDHLAEPNVQAAVKRYLTHVSTAIERLSSWPDQSQPGDRP